LTPDTSGIVTHRRYRYTSDLYNTEWATTTQPNVGNIEKYNINTIGYYNPTDKSNNDYKLVADKSQQSINLYLGATGISYNTSGLTAYYVRQNSNPVAIGLTYNSPNASWVSGGFSEISQSYTPGLYRLDLPDAASLSGVDNVSVVVRGSVGTNGAYANCQIINVLTNSSIANTVWTNASRTITGGIADTVTTLSNRAGFAITSNTDKTGYSLSQSFPANFSSLSIAGGKVSIVQSDINSIIASIPEVNYSGIAATTWNFLASAIGNTLSIGYQLISNLDATVSSRSTLTSKQVISAIQASVRTVSQVNKDKISKL
jgi:hypothetical protein